MERPDTESEDESGSSATDASDDEEEAAEGAEARPHSRRAAAKMKVAALDIINGERMPILNRHAVCATLFSNAKLSFRYILRPQEIILTRCAGRLAVN